MTNPDFSLETVKERYAAWWRQESRDPACFCIFPKSGHGYPGGTVRSWMAPAKVASWSAWQHEFLIAQAVELAAREGGNLAYVEEAANCLEAYAEATGFTAEGYPFLYLNVGASMLSALLNGQTHFNGDTVWLEGIQEVSWEEILRYDEETISPYGETVLAAFELLTRRLEGKFVFGMTDLGSPLDILAAMRQTGQLLFDLMDQPEVVDRGVELMSRLYWRWTERFRKIVDPRNRGCHTQAMRLLCPEYSEMGTCDFSAMISPEAFARWELPHLREQIARTNGNVFWHLDGPGELPHLDLLLREPGLKAIQWVMTAGVPPGDDPSHYALYRRILDAGKNLALVAMPAEVGRLNAFFKIFPAGRCFLLLFLDAEEKARRLMAGLKV